MTLHALTGSLKSLSLSKTWLKLIQSSYVQTFQNRLDTLRADCLKTAIPLIEAKTTDAVMEVLQPLFGARR